MTTFDPTIPVPDRDSAPYWAALAEGRFEIQQCNDCDSWTWPPRPICSGCQGFDVEFRPVQGTGEVHSWVRLRRGFFPRLADLVPFTIALVRIDEQADILIPARLLTEVEVHQGTRVKAVTERRSDTVGELLWKVTES